MTTLVEFLTARLDEAERIARDATHGPWSWQELPPPAKYGLVGASGRSLVVPSRTPDVYPSKYDARFIEANDPSRVLADIAAKRAIVARCGGGVRQQELNPRRYDFDTAERHALRALASVYKAHPDYREEWAPERQESGGTPDHQRTP